LEEFNDDPFASGRWVVSEWKKSDGTDGTFELSSGKYYHDKEAAQGLKTAQDAKFYHASAAFPSFSNADKTLVIQYQIKNEQRMDCGGTYLKIGPKIDDQTQLKESTVYNIMFGPDQCGSKRLTHVIFNYGGKNLDKKRDVEMKRDETSHVYTLIVKPDNTYKVKIDMNEVASGSLEADWPFLPPKKIKDPAVSKPADWVEEAEIDDPEDTKPDDWVDEATIPDPEATKPEDWDDEEDGEWTPPMKANPAYKGPWKAKRIPNPEYKGPWSHPEIDNPEYKDDATLYKYDDFSMVSIDLWQVQSGSIFDNILLCDSEAEADEIAEKFWKPLSEAEKKQKEEADKKAEEAAKAAAEAAAADDEEPEDDDDDDDDVRDEL